MQAQALTIPTVVLIVGAVAVWLTFILLVRRDPRRFNSFWFVGGYWYAAGFVAGVTALFVTSLLI